MTMKLKGTNIVKMENYQEALSNWKKSVANKESIEIQNDLYDQANAILADEIIQLAEKAGREEAEELFNIGRRDKNMTSNEIKFFNEVKVEGWKQEQILPQETVSEVFRDMTVDHHLLNAIGMEYAGVSLKIIKSNPEGAAVWGRIMGDIQGQLESTFTADDVLQSKLTAFVVLPDDMLRYGPEWVKQYVVTQIREAFAAALESAFLNGTGKDMPIGLTKQVQEGVTVTGGEYPDKTPAGTLTFTDEKTVVREVGKIMEFHATNEKGHRVPVSGRVALVVSPENIWTLLSEYTSRNAMGDYITKLPFNLDVIECEYQTPGKVTSFVKGRYTAKTAGDMFIKEYDQTLALEDCMLYTAKQMAYGMAYDNKAAAIWTLDLPNIEPLTVDAEGAAAAKATTKK